VLSCLPDCSLDVSMRPAISTQVLLVFLCLQANTDGSQVPSCYCALLIQPSRIKYIGIKPLCCKGYYNCFIKLYNSTLIHKTKIPRPLSQATTSNHLNVFTFTLPLSGRTGEAWEHSHKMTSFLPPPNKMSPTSPTSFRFHLLFCYNFYLSLSGLDPLGCPQNSL
jgi:hypothetical protein